MLLPPLKLNEEKYVSQVTEPTIAKCAKDAETSLIHFAKLTGINLKDEELGTTAAKDLITTIMHYCDVNEIDFEFILDGARWSHAEEAKTYKQS